MHFFYASHASVALQWTGSRMPTEAYDIQYESRRLFLHFLCGGKKSDKVIPAAHIPRAQVYAEIVVPDYLLHELTEARALQSSV